MRKILLLAACAAAFGFEARVEPFDVYKLKAPVSGEVVKADKNLEAKNVKNAVLVKIDDKQNMIDLKNLKIQAALLQEQIKYQQGVVKRKKDVYETYKALKTKSKTEKDLKFYDFINAYNQLLNLKSQYNNTIANIEKLKDTVSKKAIKADGYVYKIYVNRGDYVAPGVLVADIYDISKVKLSIFVPVEQIGNIKDKKVYINSKPSSFKIYKIWSVPDTKYITSYRVDLVGEGLKPGEIVSVELK